MKSKDAARAASVIPQLSVAKFIQSVEERAWTEAEKELDIIRQKSENSAWSRGYVKALEGLLLTNRNNDDKYIYLPKVLANRTEDTIGSLRKEFAEFASNQLHGEYDRGYFKALEEYLGLIGKLKGSDGKQPPPSPGLEAKKEVTPEEEHKE